MRHDPVGSVGVVVREVPRSIRRQIEAGITLGREGIIDEAQPAAVLRIRSAGRVVPVVGPVAQQIEIPARDRGQDARVEGGHAVGVDVDPALPGVDQPVQPIVGVAEGTIVIVPRLSNLGVGAVPVGVIKASATGMTYRRLSLIAN